jgi:molybdopterin-guanine dinucleotide biosynthesis protein A
MIAPMNSRSGRSDDKDVSAFILAGGKSTRMGEDKAFVSLSGQTLLSRALETSHAVAQDVRIVGGGRKFENYGPVVEDVFRDCGPLGGIHAALRASTAELNIMLAVDLPFVTPDLLRFLLLHARQSSAIVTVPRSDAGWQPLCAVYRRAFAHEAEQSLRQRRYKIDALFDRDLILGIEPGELNAQGFHQDLFRNLNTPEELAEAGPLAQEKRDGVQHA